jgi:hypothetical protein
MVLVAVVAVVAFYNNRRRMTKSLVARPQPSSMDVLSRWLIGCFKTVGTRGDARDGSLISKI